MATATDFPVGKNTGSLFCCSERRCDAIAVPLRISSHYFAQSVLAKPEAEIHTGPLTGLQTTGSQQQNPSGHALKRNNEKKQC
jgi:hypothetical protein